MNFQDFLINTTTARSGLKPSFNTGETPTQQNFHDLIDGLFLLQGDSVYKDANNGLAIRTGANDQALLFFDHESQDLTWSLDISNGLHIKDKDGNARLSVLSDGKVGVGTMTPSAHLHIISNTTSAQDNTAQFYAPNIGESSSHIHWGETGDWYIRSAAPEGKVLIQDGVAGNVGIGTATPNQKLDVKGKVRVSDENTTESVDIYYQNADINETLYPNAYPDQHERAVIFKPYTYQDGAGAGGAGYQFWTQGITGGSHPNYEKGHIQAMVIRKNGNVGIGTASPTSKLHIRGFSGSQAGLIVGGVENPTGELFTLGNPSLVVYCQTSDSQSYGLYVGHTGGTDDLFWVKGDGTGYLKNNGWQHLSDSRLKKNISSLEQSQIAQLLKLRGINYEYTHQEGKQLGFIAQEMQEVFPELVAEDEKGYLSVNYTGLIPVLTEAVKDLNNKNEALEARVLHLEQLLLNANTLN